jgi:hypothetical protein
MNLPPITLAAVILSLLTASVLLLSWDWRVSIAALGFQYLAVFMLVSVSWPIEISAVKVVAGWIAAAVLAFAVTNLPQEDQRQTPLTASGMIFGISAAILAGLFAYTGGAKLIALFPDITIAQARGGMVMISLGLLHIGLTNQPLRVVIGILTVLSGFEILYSALESSFLVTGLLATVTLGLAVVGAYLLTAPLVEETN